MSHPDLDQNGHGAAGLTTHDDDDDGDDVPIISPYDIDLEELTSRLDLSDVVDDSDSDVPLSSSSSSKRNPIETCNWLSYLTWYWVGDLFNLGKDHRLTHKDFDPLPLDDESLRLSKRWEDGWNHQQKQHPDRCPSVWRNIWIVFGYRIIWRCLPLLLTSAAKISQPLLLKQMVLFIEANDDPSLPSGGPVGLAYAYPILMTIACITQSIAQHLYFFNMYRTGAQMRVTLSTAIYKQALTLHTTHFLNTSTGGMTNLIAADTSKVEEFCLYVFYLVDAPIEVAVVLALLIDNIGVSALVGFGVLLSLVPLQAAFSKLFAAYRKKAVVYTDQRVKTVNEIITSAEVVKVYAYEKALQKVVADAREQEFHWIRKATVLKSLNMAIFFFSSPLINLLTFITYHSLGHDLSPADIFTTVSFFNVVRLPVTTYTPFAVSACSEATVSVKRIQEFMELGWTDQRKKLQQPASTHTATTSEPDASTCPPATITPVVGSIVMNNASFKWDLNSKESAGLFHLNLNLPVGCLTGIIGAIGSCKSSVLCAILGEMAQLEGDSTITGNFAYASQQSWIFNGTIRENILLGRKMKRTRYIQVLYACCLVDDVAMLPDGDMTEIGEKGVNLSGGQRARVNLARCVYGDADIFLIDDALAALDSIVARRVFINCMSDDGLLRGKTRVLVTHQTHFLHRARHLVLLEKGCIRAQGSWEEMTSTAEIRQIMHVTGEEGKKEEKKAEKDRLIAQEQETQQTSETTTALRSVTVINSLSASNLPSIAPVTTSPLTRATTDTNSDNASVTVVKKKVPQNIMSEEVSIVGTVSFAIYLNLFRSARSGMIGLLYAFFVLFPVFAVGQGVSIASDRWLAIWSSQDSSTQNSSFYLYVYCILVGCTIILGIIRSRLFFPLILNGSNALHENAFKGVLFSSMRWFESNPTGRVLNRFSKDQSIVDESLPITMFDSLQMFWMTLGSIIAVATVSPYILIVVAPLIPIFIWLRRHYLSTSREVKRLDAVSRSPVYAFFSSTLSGLITIRAFNVTDDFMTTFLKKLDVSSQSGFNFFTTTRWFGLRLDSLATLVVLATGLLMIGLRDSISASAAGFSLSYSLLLTSLFQWGVRQTAEVENQMTAAERLMQYGQLPPEGIFEAPTDGQTHTVITLNGAADNNTESDSTALTMKQQQVVIPPPSWPDAGHLIFDNYQMRYRDGLQLVIRGLNVEIKPREKIGVCGRTGAGKSSLFQSIFRLVNAADGRILIDEYDISTIPLQILRSSLSIIPQSPVIFSNTLRYNLDPFHQHTDEALWNALSAVQLSSLVHSLSSQLNTLMSEGGSNFSVGECQLICVARALLKPSRILLVDEATANVDMRTDQMIQDIIKQQFADRTVITVAHRLNTILHSDRILVMDAGRAVEYDTPQNLLAKDDGQGSIFKEMMQQTQGKQNK